MNRAPGIIVTEPRGDGCSVARWHAPGLTVRVAWRALRAAFEADAANPSSESVKLFREGRPVVHRMLWPHRDGSSDDPWPWSVAFGSSTYFAWARAVQSFDRPMFEALVEAASAEFSRRGLPSGPAEAEVFLGDYGYTPGGIHREACSNIHLVLSGAKTMHFWSGSAWPSHGTPRRVDIAGGTGTREEYLPDLDPAVALGEARSLTAETGGGFSWAAGTWHVGETHGPTMALNIAAYQRDLDAEPPMPPWGNEFSGEVSADWLAQYRDHVGRDDSAASLLARVSALGMRPARPTRPPCPGQRGRWRLEAPVLWMMVARGSLLVATLGSVRRHESSTTLLDWLAARPRLGTESVVPPELRDLVAWLHEQGVFDVVPERTATAQPDNVEGQ